MRPSLHYLRLSPGAYIQRGDLMEGFCVTSLRGLYMGGAYFRNFTVDDFLQIPLL